MLPIEQTLIEQKERRACLNVAEIVAEDDRFDEDTARTIAGRIQSRGRTGTGYYQQTQLPEETGIETLRAIFNAPESGPVDYTMNWLFLSTSGVHGTYTTLDAIEEDAARLFSLSDCWNPDHQATCTCGAPEDDDNHCYVRPDGRFRITVLVVKPRIVQTTYGTIFAHVDDIPWMRKAVEGTVAGVATSQMGNIPESTP